MGDSPSPGRDRRTTSSSAGRRGRCSTATRDLASVVRPVVRPLALALAAAGCAFSPFRHLESVPASVEPLEPGEVNRTRASDDVAEAAADGLFVGVALSGGGSRAAVFDGEVLCRLHELGVMDRVDFVSGISMGSLAGAYYCAARSECEAQEGDLVWRRDVVEDLMRRGVWFDYFASYVMNPWNLLRYYGTGLHRSYQMRGVMDAIFFHEKTLGELNPRRPRLLVTATTLETGAVFTFTDRRLADLGIRSQALRIADAVQASASFPGVFHPYVLPRYEQEQSGPVVRSFVHLVDGGVYDNLGVAPLLRVYRENRADFPRGGVIVVADASMPVEVKEALALQADARGFTDYVLDFGTMVQSLEIMFEVDRLGLLRALRGDAEHLGLRLVHLHYTTGLLSGDRDLHDEIPNVLDLDDPAPTNVHFGDKRDLVAPTSLGISDEHARATREAARRVVAFQIDALLAIAEGR